MWVVAGILAMGVCFLLLSTLSSSRGEAQVATGTCPSCAVPMQHLRPAPTEQPPRSWEVLACPTCAKAVPLVQGMPGNAGWCPRCNQRALELEVRRLEADPLVPIRVEVAETCHLCGHHADVLVEHRIGAGRGKVIPFPGNRG